MAYPKFPSMQQSASGARRITPQQQLWELTNERQHYIFRQVFRRIKKRDQEDLCYGMIAYIRFKIRRPFESPFMQTLFESFIDLVEHRYDNDDDTLRYDNSQTH